MAFQDGSVEYGVPKNLLTLMGTDLMGLPLGAPRCTYETIYVLPMMSISMTMGSGIVTRCARAHGPGPMCPVVPGPLQSSAEESCNTVQRAVRRTGRLGRTA